MEIRIDRKSSGFCFGVLNAIKTAEAILENYGHLFCLGDIVHNNKEVERLRKLGLIVIDHDDLENLYNTRVLIRAHGEPPSTYETARRNNIRIIEATCPVVIKLQTKVKAAHEEMQTRDGQVVIFGKEGHAEVVGLKGQTHDEALIIGNEMENISRLDFTKPITLFSQTTQDKESYAKIKHLLEAECLKHGKENAENFRAHNTICGQVSNRGPRLADFARENDVVIFVSGKKSSNGKYLYKICQEANPDSWLISDKSELLPQWFTGKKTAGICGATSTPLWLMEEVESEIRKMTFNR
jgi:4-hydroxy-3-methylbut-2-en-1-yl diphosphate reductase